MKYILSILLLTATAQAECTSEWRQAMRDRFKGLAYEVVEPLPDPTNKDGVLLGCLNEVYLAVDGEWCHLAESVREEDIEFCTGE